MLQIALDSHTTYRAQLSSELDTLSDVVVRILGGHELGRRLTVLDPVDHGGEDYGHLV